MAHSSLRLMYQSFYRHPPAPYIADFPLWRQRVGECVTRRESARIFFPSALGGTFLRFSSALSSLAALCLFLFLRRQMLLTALTLMRSWSSPLPASRCSSRLFLPPPSSFTARRSIFLEKDEIALHSRFIRPSEEEPRILYVRRLLLYCGGADDHSFLGDITAGQSTA